MVQACDSFSVCVDVVIRPCRECDLPALEWFGLFASHRPLIRRLYEQHRRGEAVMLVAEVNGEASGQLWIELACGGAQPLGRIWAVRVLPCLQRRGIGTRLIAAAEALLLEGGIGRAELSVETGNPRARHLYELLGYRLVGTFVASHPCDLPAQDVGTQWVLAKELRAAGPMATGSMP